MANLKQLAAQKCADDYNATEVGGVANWRPETFMGNSEHRSLYERIHHAIIAYEAGDKTALDPFRLVEPVDPLLREARELCAAVVEDISDAGSLRTSPAYWCDKYLSGDCDNNKDVQKVLAALRRDVEIGRAERG